MASSWAGHRASWVCLWAALAGAACAGEVTPSSPTGTGEDAGTGSGSVHAGTGGAGTGEAGTGDSGGAPMGDAAAPRDSSTSEDAAPSDASSDGSSDAGAGPGGDSGPYNPCPPKGTVCKIMPLGDSITQDVSTTQQGGYRIPLLRTARAAGQSITFVGSNATGPSMLDGMPFPRANEGHSGWTIAGSQDGLYPKIVEWMNSTTPHIITMMIGTNDIYSRPDSANAPMRLGLLIDRIVQTDPKVLLVVAQIIPSLDDAANSKFSSYNETMSALVKTRADAGKHVMLVDMYKAFTKNTNFKTAYFPPMNTLHPNEAGYVVMADVWYTAIGGLLR